MQLQLAIERSANWLLKSSALVDGLEFAASDRSRVAAALFHLCVEHQQAVHTLVDASLMGSAFTLLRPQFEAYVRGVWYHRCALETQIGAFLAGAEPPKISSLLADIAELEDFNSDSLISTKKAVWSVLNEFTHGGSVQVRARITAAEIVRRYKDEHVVGMLQWSAILSFLGYIGMAAIGNDDALASSVRDCFLSIYPACTVPSDGE